MKWKEIEGNERKYMEKAGNGRKTWKWKEIKGNERKANGRQSKEMNGDRSSKSPHKHQMQQMNVTNLIC